MAARGGIPLLLTQMRALAHKAAEKALAKAGQKGLEESIFKGVFEQIGKKLTLETIGKSVPYISAGIGALIDLSQMNTVMKYADIFYQKRFIMEKQSKIDMLIPDIIDVIDEATKELPTGYEERFNKYKDDIENVIITDTPLNNEMLKYSDLVSYIRQSVLRYGEAAYTRMNNVGICLSKEQVAAIMYKLTELSIPKEICYKNRYWDPFVLDNIYVNYTENVPSHPLERGAKAKLNRMLKFLRDTKETSLMYERYVPAELRTGSNRGLLCDLCMLWAKETPLSEILNKKLYTRENEVPDQIEDTIKILQNIVAYNIPLLIKPIFDIKNGNSSFVSAMQSGAYRKVTRYLIGIGVPRECASFIFNSLFTDYDEEKKSDENIENDVIEIIHSHFIELPYWIRVQIEFII